jgi:predicted glutamine amidotransferase
MTQKERRILELEAIIGGFNKVINDTESEVAAMRTHTDSYDALDNILNNLHDSADLYKEELRQLRTNLYQIMSVDQYGDYLEYFGVFRAISEDEALEFAARHYNRPEIAGGGNYTHCARLVTENELYETEKYLRKQLRLATRVLN